MCVFIVAVVNILRAAVVTTVEEQGNGVVIYQNTHSVKQIEAPDWSIKSFFFLLTYHILSYSAQYSIVSSMSDLIHNQFVTEKHLKAAFQILRIKK